ncbi:TetR/AcrR family transcriptional regulator [Leifsonia sp. Leaf336]|uniref:TetR/AcrR family transcriptional regulator n=1 Tax=Leifsonia sp. Leaf336 TaxID=1736341 RepID=UPI00138F06D5|nr:TetR/AcrR family transcriptional regulator [Leifsonia sp. Leaf336]
MKTSRAYEMRTRAEQTEQTRLRILDATVTLAAEKPIVAVALPDIAKRAGVSVQTVLRQFGSRDGVFDAAEVHVRAEVIAELVAPPGDLDAIIEALMAHYELRGDDVLMFLGQERWEPRAAAITDEGRRMHLAWVQRVFAPFLPDDTDEREAVIDFLMVATDVYTWKILRRDRGLSFEETARRVRRMIEHTVQRTENVDHPLRHR